MAGPVVTQSARSQHTSHAGAESAARLRTGDPDAIRDALLELLPDVRRWLHHLLGKTPDLDDATQEVLVELAKFLPTFEGRSKLTTAAHTITVRVAYRYFGARVVVPLESVPDLVDPEANIDDRVMAREALARLQRCLQRLPAKRRIAFVLCAIEGLTPTEAAERAGTSALAMRCRLLWARREIARMLRTDPYLAAWLPAEGDEP
jgi:RNA polymerase sigma factor (sigma-70 family)